MVFGAMMEDIGRSKTVSNRGKSKSRTIKSKPRPRFPVRKRGTKSVANVFEKSVYIVK
jgi:hypothetical protein